MIAAPKTLLIGEPKSKVSVFYTEYDKGLRCLVLYLANPNLDDHNDLLKGIFNSVTTHKAFIEFGNYKSIIVSAVMFQEMRDIANSTEYNFHHNVLFKPSTTFDQYYREIGDYVNHKLEHGYGYEVIDYYKVKVWNLDNMKNAKIKIHNKNNIEFLGYRSYSTKALTNTSNLKISPIKTDKGKSPFATMDIETMNINGVQTPVAISCCNSKTSKLFIIDYELLKIDLELAVSNLWDQYFDHINKVEDELIFAHNLGSNLLIKALFFAYFCSYC